MEKQQEIKCSSKEHHEIDAINFCIECKVYMCKKCLNFHSDLFQNHHTYDIYKDNKDIFTGFCNEQNHSMKLEFFCKNHNILCCAACICKIKDKGYGFHKDCETYVIENVKEKKKNNLTKNMEKLEELSKNIDNQIKDLKNIFEKICIDKEELKIKIQKIFTKIRTELNDREDILLKQVDDKYEDLFFKEDLITNIEKLPSNIKLSLENGKNINKFWNDKNKLSSLINDCIKIEKNIENINELNEKILKIKENINLEIIFNPEEIQNHYIVEQIKSFGNILEDSNFYIFKKCQDNIQEDKTFIIEGNKENIMTRITPFSNWNWRGTTTLYELEKGKEYIWKIKILKTQRKLISVGVAPINFIINKSDWHCGWYLECSISSLCSGPPHNYHDYKGFNLTSVKDEVIVIMNMEKKTLKFIIDNEDKGDQYTDIPIDKPLFPTVLLVDKDDSIEIINYK